LAAVEKERLGAHTPTTSSLLHLDTLVKMSKHHISSYTYLTGYLPHQKEKPFYGFFSVTRLHASGSFSKKSFIHSSMF
jgi:hypothetical protein